MSLRNSNLPACKALCQILKANDLDGYYYKGDGKFHEEVMLCDASNKILKVKCKNIYGGTTVHKNENVIFVRNILEKPNATSNNLKKLLNSIPMSKLNMTVIKERLKQLYLNEISKTSLNKNLNKVVKQISKTFYQNPVLDEAVANQRKKIKVGIN